MSVISNNRAEHVFQVDTTCALTPGVTGKTLDRRAGSSNISQ